ncbi:uncharacterized protein [Palaemon carinicauda]|uniref:uncharacterized protein n=1 Tax=Palaemon carinicauda TaxID=392227 RepID=UPI0035B58FB1
MTTNTKAAEADAEVKVTSKGVMKKESHREAKRHSHRKKRKKDSPEDICRPKATFQKLGHRNHTAFEVPVSVTSRPYRKIIQDFTVSSPSYSSFHHLPLVPSSFPISPASSCRSSPNRLLPLLLFLLLHNHVGLMTDAFSEISGTENEVTQVEVVSGFNASLPCTIRIPVDDAPLLTLWYLEENETPIYSYDQRTGVSGTSWADKGVFGGRAHYLAHLSPPVMLIMRASIKDERLYRCRIDFHNSNSRETWVRLRVIVPPERVQITSQFSPVRLGQRDDVVCTAIGGKPPPSVVWLQRGIAVDPNSTVGQSGSFNWLEIPASREDLDSPFTCQATNNNLTPPVFAVYIRNVTCSSHPFVAEPPAEEVPVQTVAVASPRRVPSPQELEVFLGIQVSGEQQLVNGMQYLNQGNSPAQGSPLKNCHLVQQLCRHSPTGGKLGDMPSLTGTSTISAPSIGGISSMTKGSCDVLFFTGILWLRTQETGGTVEAEEVWVTGPERNDSPLSAQEGEGLRATLAGADGTPAVPHASIPSEAEPKSPKDGHKTQRASREAFLREESATVSLGEATGSSGAESRLLLVCLLEETEQADVKGEVPAEEEESLSFLAFGVVLEGEESFVDLFLLRRKRSHWEYGHS